jgi:hypothetical protein
MSEHNEGGRPYFDALDAEMRASSHLILPLILSVPFFRPIAIQGKFGLAVCNLIAEHNLNHKIPGVIWLKSSPRQNEKTEIFQKGAFNHNPVFIDDSCYSGKTLEAVDRVIEEHIGLNVQYAHVIYDGCKTKLEAVHSFYRYYDYY